MCRAGPTVAVSISFLSSSRVANDTGPTGEAPKACMVVAQKFRDAPSGLLLCALEKTHFPNFLTNSAHRLLGPFVRVLADFIGDLIRMDLKLTCRFTNRFLSRDMVDGNRGFELSDEPLSRAFLLLCRYRFVSALSLSPLVLFFWSTLEVSEWKMKGLKSHATN